MSKNENNNSNNKLTKKVKENLTLKMMLYLNEYSGKKAMKKY